MARSGMTPARDRSSWRSPGGKTSACGVANGWMPPTLTAPAPAAAEYPRPALDHLLDDPGLTRSAQSDAWLAALRSEGARREKAIRRLHELLLRAARFELGRRRAALSFVRGEELDDLAMQAADDALMAVLAKLDQFRGA